MLKTPLHLHELARSKDNVFEIRRVGRDYGPATKLMHALREFTDPSDVIITIDDDVLLEKHSLEELLHYHENVQQSFLGFIGVAKTNDEQYFVHAEYLNQSTMSQMHMLGGYRSVLYPRNLFEDDVFFIFDSIEMLHVDEDGAFPVLEDDTFWAQYAHYKKIDLVVCMTKYPCRSSENGWNFEIQELGNALYDMRVITARMKLSAKLITDHFKKL